VGQVVVVRHDTGATLLATQLDLPQQALLPLQNAQPAPRLARFDSEVEPAQYVDDDDSSVQLLPDEMPLPNGAAAAPVPLEMIDPNGPYPAYSEPMGPGMAPGMMGPGCGPECYGPMPYGPGGPPFGQPMIGPYPAGPGMYAPYAEVQPQRKPDPRHCSADIEFNLLRAQFSEDVVGKLSEEYLLSPRIILSGGVGNIAGRIRYWHFGRETHVLGDDGLRLKFDVLDLEATHEFCGRYSELTLGGGLRLAGIHLEDTAGQESGGDFFGLTMAADGLTPLHNVSGGHFGLVYGGRLSLLSGNWGGDDNSVFVNNQERSDNVVVHELYAGIELARQCGFCLVRARLDFEMQNWHSDVLSSEADIDSIAFLGPGFQLGAEF
jgi:hypothetical protein